MWHMRTWIFMKRDKRLTLFNVCDSSKKENTAMASKIYTIWLCDRPFFVGMNFFISEISSVLWILRERERWHSAFFWGNKINESDVLLFWGTKIISFCLIFFQKHLTVIKIILFSRDVSMPIRMKYVLGSYSIVIEIESKIFWIEKVSRNQEGYSVSYNCKNKFHDITVKSFDLIISS